MHGVTVRWVGQSFALPRCSASSSENRTRTRRTKEERRTMAEAFIKKYQSSNNGKFPSLNLTHKEVGGSFYIIREIVRDIIQENKVLGPGNPSSKLLNLKYYLDEEEDKGSFLDVHGNISVSTVVNGQDQVQHEVVPSMEDHEISIDQDNTLIKSVIFSKTYLNENSYLQGLQVRPNFAENISDGIVLHEEVSKTADKESNGQVLTEKKDDAFLLEIKLKNEDTHSKISVSRQSLEDGINISESACTGNIPETNLIFSDGADDQSKFCPKLDNGIFPLVSDTLGQDNSSGTPVLPVSDTSEIFESGYKVHLAAELYEDGAAIDKSDLESARLNNINSTFRISETSFIANNGVIPLLPFDKEYTNSSEQHGEIASFSERNVDVAESKNVDNVDLQSISPSAPGPAENDVHMVDKFSSFVDAIKESESVSGNFFEPIIQEADHTEIKVGKQSDAGGTVNDGGFMSSSNATTAKESRMLETNPLWAAIKSFVSSLIKFWSE